MYDGLTTGPVQSSRRQFMSRQRIWHIVSTALPISLLVVFAAVHIQSWLSTGSPAGLAFAFQESILISLFLIRRTPIISSTRPLDWTYAFFGSYGGMLFQPSGTEQLVPNALSLPLQVSGALLAMLAIVSLGRSFGIVAANRGIKTRGAYRLVRHPIYAAYLVGMAGYLLASFSVFNLVVAVLVVAAQVQRMNAEEAVLLSDPDYQEYTTIVRHRVIPGIY